LLYALQSADAAPTTEQETALGKFEQTLATTEQQWNTLLSVELPKLNQQLKTTGQKTIATVPEPPPDEDYGGNDRDQ
jgi:hypothetical protein